MYASHSQDMASSNIALSDGMTCEVQSLELLNFGIRMEGPEGVSLDYCIIPTTVA